MAASQHVGEVIPALWIGTVEVHISLRTGIGVHADVGIGDVRAGPATVPIDGFEPIPPLSSIDRFKRPRAVVLGPAHDVPQGILRVYRQALELEGWQPIVQAKDLRGYRAQPLLALRELGVDEAASVTAAGGISEGTAGADYSPV